MNNAMREARNTFPYATPWGECRILIQDASMYGVTQGEGLRVEFFTYEAEERTKGGDAALAKTALVYQTKNAKRLIAVGRYILDGYPRPGSGEMYWEAQRTINTDPKFFAQESPEKGFYMITSSGYSPFTKFFRESIDKWIAEHPREMAESVVARARIAASRAKRVVEKQETLLTEAKEKLGEALARMRTIETNFFQEKDRAALAAPPGIEQLQPTTTEDTDVR